METIFIFSGNECENDLLKRMLTMIIEREPIAPSMIDLLADCGYITDDEFNILFDYINDVLKVNSEVIIEKEYYYNVKKETRNKSFILNKSTES